MKKNNEPIVNRGDIYYADLSPVIGSEQGGLRPVLIVQNDIGNKHAPTVIAAPLTTCMSKRPLPTHVALSDCGLVSISVALMEQIRTIDKRRLKTYIGHVSQEQQEAVNKALYISLGLT